MSKISGLSTALKNGRPTKKIAELEEFTAPELWMTLILISTLKNNIS